MIFCIFAIFLLYENRHLVKKHLQKKGVVSIVLRMYRSKYYWLNDPVSLVCPESIP